MNGLTPGNPDVVTGLLQVDERKVTSEFFILTSRSSVAHFLFLSLRETCGRLGVIESLRFTTGLKRCLS